MTSEIPKRLQSLNVDSTKFSILLSLFNETSVNKTEDEEIIPAKCDYLSVIQMGGLWNWMGEIATLIGILIETNSEAVLPDRTEPDITEPDKTEPDRTLLLQDSGNIIYLWKVWNSLHNIFYILIQYLILLTSTYLLNAILYIVNTYTILYSTYTMLFLSTFS